MSRRFALLPLTLLAVSLAAAPAHAATTIGDTTSTPLSPSAPAGFFMNTADAAGHPYTVPTGGGVITSVSVLASKASSGGAAGSVQVLAMRGSGPTYTVVGTTTLSVTGSGASLTKTTTQTRMAVASGDRLAVYSSDSLVGGILESGATLGFAIGTTAAPGVGSTVTTSSSSAGFAASVSATVEADADGDGYGDETQDACPADAARHVGTCVTDLQTAITSAPSTLTVGDVSSIVATVSASKAVATGATADLTIPAGLQVIAASSTVGQCSAAKCPLGDIPAGGSSRVYLVVRGVTAGAQTLGVAARSGTNEADTTNDATSAVITVTPTLTSTTPTPTTDVTQSTTTQTPAQGASTAPPTIQYVTVPSTTAPTAITTPVKLCKVPSLRGKTAAAAKKALLGAGCIAGTAKGSKAKTATVSAQLIPAGVQVVAGTKVGFTLKAKRATKK